MTRTAHNAIDATGHVYGELTVLEFAYVKNKARYWLCRCSCGVEKVISLNSMRSGYATSCGHKKRQAAHNRLDLTGHVFGDLTVIEFSRKEKYASGDVYVYWKCQCSCGVVLDVKRALLTKGKTSSCGGEVHRKWGQDNYHWKGGEFIPGAYFASLRRGAEARGLAFDIEIPYAEMLLKAQDFKCAYTGFPLFFTKTVSRKAKLGNASLDRIDSNLGYVEGNLQWVHKLVNNAKWDLSHTEFVAMCHLVAQTFPLSDSNHILENSKVRQIIDDM